MTLLEAIAVLAAGFAAGGVNAIVGSGSLITFPVLLAVGYPSVVANVSNTVGLVPGGISGVIGYRRELEGQWRRALILACGTSAGAIIGGILLLELPDAVFDAVVPILILLAVVLMAIKRTPKQHADGENIAGGTAASFATGIYGGYFGAAQGIILMSLLRFCFPDDLQRLNALKNVLAGRGQRRRGDPLHRGRRRRLGGGGADRGRLGRRRAGRRALRAPHPVRGPALDRRYRRGHRRADPAGHPLTSPPLCPSNMTASLSAPGRVDMSPRSVPPSSG